MRAENYVYILKLLLIIVISKNDGSTKYGNQLYSIKNKIFHFQMKGFSKTKISYKMFILFLYQNFSSYSTLVKSTLS